jgi:hypothetical protein
MRYLQQGPKRSRCEIAYRARAVSNIDLLALVLLCSVLLVRQHQKRPQSLRRRKTRLKNPADLKFELKKFAGDICDC